MFQGIVTVRVFEQDALIEEQTYTNSITASGIRRIVNGQAFDNNAVPSVMIYDHAQPIDPGVVTLNGYLDTGVQPYPPEWTYNSVSKGNEFKVTARFAPTGVTRTIRTVGLSTVGQEAHPSFAVRLGTAVSQTATRTVEITYTISARQINCTTKLSDTDVSSNATNNTWGNLFKNLLGEYNGGVADPSLEFAVVDTIHLLDCPNHVPAAGLPPSFMGSAPIEYTTRLGSRHTNYVPDVTLPPSAVVKHYDEASISVTIELENEDYVGVHFSKSLSTTDCDIPVYINEMGYTGPQPVYSVQTPYHHSPSSQRPYANTTDAFAYGHGEIIAANVGPHQTLTSQMYLPVYVSVNMVRGGVLDEAEYTISTRYTNGFTDNDPSKERPFVLPTFPRIVGGIEETEYESGLTGESQAAAIGIIDISTPARRRNDNEVPSYTLYPRVAFVHQNKVDIYNGLGEQIVTKNLVATDVVAADRFINDMLVACRNTGLYRVGIGAGTANVRVSVPALGALDQSCLAVGTSVTMHPTAVSGNPWAATAVAVYDGGIVLGRLNGNTLHWSWVYGGDSDKIIDINPSYPIDWANVKHVVVGATKPPQLIGEGVPVPNSVLATVAIVFGDDTVRIAELRELEAAISDPIYIPGVHKGGLQNNRHKWWPSDVDAGGDVYPSVQTFVFSGTNDAVYRLDYTLGVLNTTPVELTGEFAVHNMKSRIFERLPNSDTEYGMTAIRTVGGSSTAVLLNKDFNQVVNGSTEYTDTPEGLDSLKKAEFKAYRHFYLTTSPTWQLFNPWASASLFASPTNYLIWNNFEYSALEGWVRTANNSSAGQGQGRLAHAASLRVPQLGSPLTDNVNMKLLSDIDSPLQIAFQDNATAGAWYAGEKHTFTITSGIQKDEYTAFTHTSSHSFYRTKYRSNINVQPWAAINDPMTNHYMSFNTRHVDQAWYSHRGTLSSDVATNGFVRSEFVYRDHNKPLEVEWNVSTAPSAGQFMIGFVKEGVPISSADPIENNMPFRIEYTTVSGESYFTVMDGASLIIGPFPLDPSGAGHFVLGYNRDGDKKVELIVDGTVYGLGGMELSGSWITSPIAIGAYTNNNENRYVYNFKLNSWPHTYDSGSVTIAYARLRTENGGSSAPVSANPSFVSIESRIEPSSFEVTGGPSDLQVITDPSIVMGLGSGAPPAVQLLPKSGAVLLRNIPNINDLSFSFVSLEK